MTTLYKLNNNNNLSWWKIEQTDNTYTITWGQQIGGKEHGNNHYKEPTPEEAEAKVASLIAQQIDRKGYSITRPLKQPDRPMLAQKYQDRVEDVETWESIYIQPKLDGLRCIATSEKMTTRKNLPINTCPNISQVLTELPPEIKLDGELYIHGTDMETIQGYVIRNRAHKLHYLIEYHVFDLVDTELPFKERTLILRQVVKKLQDTYKEMFDSYIEIPEKLRPKHTLYPSSCPIQLVDTLNIETTPNKHKQVFNSYLQDHMKAGYEGSIIRNGNGFYSIDYRSPDLLKHKQRLSEEFEIIDISAGYGNTGIFVCRTSEGKTFEATPSWTNERKRWLLNNKERFIGRILTVEFERYSKDNIPLKPIGKTTRED